MTDALTCPQCDAELPSNAPAGICPRCLMQAALADSSDANHGGHDSPYAETTPQPQSFLPPEIRVLADQFPHLEILALLGQGGMGAVYKARQPKLDRMVALKVIRPESADDPTFAERFNREAKTLARLNHPNIVGIHDFGEVTVSNDESGDLPKTLYYFLMEYVDGANLRQMMEREELKPARALTIMPQICEALQFAHDEGIVHRDIKPENILIDSRGRVKIADFGLAKLASPSEQDFTLTGTHQVMGTPRYMAPEQMAGSRTVDHRADLYSLGVVIYEMLTGQIPAGHFSPPSEHAAIDGRLDDVVMKALAQKPEDRFQSASEIRASLEAIALEQYSVLSQSGAAELPPARGLSTVFERQVAAAWHWMVDKTPSAEAPVPAKTSAQFPSLLMGLLCIIGLLLPLAPWMTIAVTDPDVVHGIPSEELTMFHGSSSKVIEKSGFEHPAGIVSAILLTILAVLCLSVPSWRKPNRLIGLAMVVMSAGALVSVFFFPNQTEHIYLHYKYFYDVGSGETEYTWNQNPISQLDHKVYLQPGFYGSLSVSGILLLLSAIGLRHAEPLRKSDRTWREVWTGELAANLLLASTIVLSLTGGLSMLLPWAEIKIPLAADVTQVDDTARLVAPVTQSFTGTDVWSSTAAPALCLLVGFILLLSPQRRSPGWIVAGLMTIFSTAALIHLATYPAALQSHRSITLPLEVSEQAARWLSTTVSSGDFQVDPANVKTVEIEHQISLRSLSRFVTHREGYYTALGVSLSLLLLSVIGVRNAILNRETQPKTDASWGGTPLASLRFTAPVKGDIGSKIRFHFLGLGYELEKEQQGSWIFRRGTTMGGMMQTDIRAYPTRLSVHSIQDDNGQYLINCHWSVRLMGGWAGKSDVRMLEDEGRELESLLRGGSSLSVATAVASTSVEPADAVVASVASDSERGAPPAAEMIDEADASDAWIKPGSPQIDLSDIEEEVNLPAYGMMVVGLVMAIAHIVVMVMMLEEPQADGFEWMAIPGILCGLGLLAGGIGLQGFRSRSWAQVGIVAGFLPVSPAFVFTMIISVVAMNALSKPQVRLAFRERKNRKWDELTRRSSDAATTTLDLVEVEDEISGPATAMIVVGAVEILATVICAKLLELAGDLFFEEVFFLCFPPVLIGLTMIVGGLCLKRLSSRAWAQTGIVAGMLPVTPAWIMTIGVCVWAQMTIRRNPEVERGFRERARQRVEQEVSGPAMAMMVVGFLMMLGHGIAGLAMASGMDPTIDELAVMAVPGIFVGLAMLIGGFFLHDLRSQGWAHVGIIAGFLPVSPAFILTMVTSVIALNALSKPRVKLEFRERKNRRRGELKRLSSGSGPADAPIDLVAIEDQVNVPSIAMIVLGALMPLGHFLLISMLIESRNSTPSMVMALIPAIPMGLLLLIGGLCLRKFASRGWAQIGIIAGMLPVSPLWVFSAGVCVWAQMLMAKPEIQWAFLDRARGRRGLDRSEPPTVGLTETHSKHVPVRMLLALMVWSVFVVVGGMASYAWLRNELSVTQVVDNRAGTLVPNSGAYEQVTVTVRGTTRSKLLLKESNVERNLLEFRLTPLKYSDYHGGTGVLEVELPLLGWRAPLRDSSEIGRSAGLTPDALKEWMGLSGVDLNVEGVDREARALFEIANKAARTPPHELVDPSLFTVTAGEIRKVTNRYQELQHARYCLYVWLGGVVLVLLVTVLWKETAPNSLGRTLLHFVTLIMILAGVTFLLYLAGGVTQTKMVPTHGVADERAASSDSTSKLLAAAARGDTSEVKQLLDSGIDVNDKDEEGRTPLMMAAANGHGSLCQLLLLLGANAGEQDKQGKTALIHAAENSQDSVFKAFFDIEYRSRQNEAEKALQELSLDWRLLKDVDLKNRGTIYIAPDVQDVNGETALMKVAANGDTELVKTMLGGTYAVDNTVRDANGRSALMHAVINRQSKFVREFAQLNYDRVVLWAPESLDDQNTLHNGMLGFLSLFNLDSLRITDNEGKTAYQLATKQGDSEMADAIRRYLDLLISKETEAIALDGADVRWCYRDRGYAYQALGETEKAAEDLKRAGQAETPRTPSEELQSAAANGDAGRVKQLFDVGASVNDKDAEGRTPLMLAAANGHASLAATLVLLGANVNEKDKQGLTTMMYAVENGHEPVRKAIEEVITAARISNKADRIETLRQLPGIDQRLIEGVAIDIEDVSIDALAQDKQGETVLMKAVKSKNIPYLRDADYHPGDSHTYRVARLQDAAGRTALMHAIESGGSDLVLSIHEVGLQDVYMDYLQVSNHFVGDYKLNPMFDPRVLSRSDKEEQTALKLAEQLGMDETAKLIRDEMERFVEIATRAIGNEEVKTKYRPQWLNWFSLRGHAYLALGEKEKAETDFQKAREQD